MFKKKQSDNTFVGEITISPSDKVTPQIVITTSLKVANHLDKLLLSKGIVALKEYGEKKGTFLLRIDIPDE